MGIARGDPGADHALVLGNRRLRSKAELKITFKLRTLDNCAYYVQLTG